jgi:hypothetical protein
MEYGTASVLREVHFERQRQEELRLAGKFLWTCAHPKESNARKLAVLSEEFGEVARKVTDEINLEDKVLPAEAAECRVRLRKELIQVAAVCVAWVESLKT